MQALQECSQQMNHRLTAWVTSLTTSFQVSGTCVWRWHTSGLSHFRQRRSPLTHSSPGPGSALAPQPSPWALLWVDAERNNERMSVPKSMGQGSQGEVEGPAQSWHGWSHRKWMRKGQLHLQPNYEITSVPEGPISPPPSAFSSKTKERNSKLKCGVSACMQAW